MALLAASGGDTVKLFDVSVESGDPCTLNYTPSPGFQVNSVKWNHTNLVVASAGDDKKVTLWRTNGQSMGTIPVSGTDSGNDEEAIFSIAFSNKGSRYLCSGGSGHVVKIWDLQRKRCIKWLRGHVNTITGTAYNCKDEHLASISLSGDLIVHNLASGAKAADLKDPEKQMLRVLDYSRISRHLLVTAGDDGSVHLWDTTGRNPKVSWSKQHSAPTAGVGFSPTNDKVIASVGLDKKLYTFDLGTKKHTSCISYDVPFSSLSYRDDGLILAAGTSNGGVVFYDVRGKLQPFTVLRAYSNMEAVTSLSWQRSKPIVVNESTCTVETALLGGAIEDSILMPDPLPSSTSSSLSHTTSVSGLRNSGRNSSTMETPFLSTIGSGEATSTFSLPTLEETTPQRNSLWPGGTLTRLHPTRTYNFKDDMEVFSPLVEVQPITPSLDKLWSENDGLKRQQVLDKKPSFLSPLYDWKSGSTSKQDDILSFPQLSPSSAASSKSDDSSSITPPEAWGGARLADKYLLNRQLGSLPSRFSISTSGGGLTSTSVHTNLQDPSSSTSQTSTASLTNTGINFLHSRTKEITSGLEATSGSLGHVPFSSLSLPTGKSTTSQSTSESTMPASLSHSRRFSTFAERISTAQSFGDGTSPLLGSPKTKKTGAETREELLNSLLSRMDTSSANETGVLPSINGTLPHPQRTSTQTDTHSSFTLQLFQRTLEETLASFQNTMHEDVRNLHIEILRQFHMQEMEMSTVLNTVLKNQAELMQEVQALRKENQQLQSDMGYPKLVVF
ncbi:hypothetical protein V2J09_001415 [Rumex salicifolius]